MFFSRLGKFVAWALLILSLIPLGFGYGIAFFAENPATIAKQYFNAPSTGIMIDKGFLWFGIAIALGTLSEIGQAVASKDSN